MYFLIEGIMTSDAIFENYIVWEKERSIDMEIAI